MMNTKQLSVLIAEDEPDVLAVMARRLTEAGFRAIPVPDGGAACEHLASEVPDIMVLDVNMPCKSGFEVLGELRSLPAEKLGNRWVPVIIVSAQGELEDMRRGFDLLADHYLVKPCKMEDLVNAVNLMAGLIPLRVLPA